MGFPKVHFGEVFTGLNVAAKSTLRKFEVFTGENLAAYQIAYKFHTKCLTKIRTKFEKLLCYPFETLYTLTNYFSKYSVRNFVHVIIALTDCGLLSLLSLLSTQQSAR